MRRRERKGEEESSKLESQNAQHSRRIVGQVQEQRNSIQGSVLLEILFEESSSLHVDSHSSEDDREVILVSVVDSLGGSWTLDETSLSTDLGGDLD